MGELAIRRNRGYGVAPRQETARPEKTASGGESRKASSSPGITVSETLRQRIGGVGLAEARESRRTLQSGEAALAEVGDRLERMAELARESAGDGAADREGLQEALKQLAEQVDRMLSSVTMGGTPLFLDGETSETDVLLALMKSGGAKENGALPDWLTEGLQGDLTADRLLEILGVDKNSRGAELLEAIANAPLEKSSLAGRLTALFAGAVLIKGSPFGSASVDEALEGLEKLLNQTEDGVTVEEVFEAITGDHFTSLWGEHSLLLDEIQLGIGNLLIELLLNGTGPELIDLFQLLSDGFGGGENGLLDLLLAFQASGVLPDPDGDSEAAGLPAAQVQPLGDSEAEAAGRDLSGVSYDGDAGELTASGTAPVAVRQAGALAVRLEGSGAVVLQGADGTAVTVNTAAARLFLAGAAVLGEVRLGEGASLTLGGSGLIRMAALLGGTESVVRLRAGTAAAVGEDGGGTDAVVTVPVVLEGPASLAARAVNVRDAAGRPLEPFDVIWKALLPGWNRVESLEIDGRQARMALLQGEPARLWLDKGDRGHPIHTVVLRGRDQEGNQRTRYAYLHWNQSGTGFEEVPMYPNPFTVTGGELGRDWVYEEETQTLRILSAQVTGVSGGAGVDASQGLFCGRMALEDGIGALTLTLGGVDCRTKWGSAFSLGRENDVTLLLQNGTENYFEAGPGYAGIALGEGASLRIDCPQDRSGGRTPLGTLAASGGRGGAGIGRDSGGGRDQTSRIVICGGVIQAAGSGGGAGIGAGKGGCMGEVTILGGTVSATGAKGGAGIGGGLTAAVGEIVIRGGKITAVAASHAAAIGAGVRGDCGGIRIEGAARIVKALGGNPGADIGGCLFGGCGEVTVSSAASLGRAKLWTGKASEEEDGVTLPQFRLSGKSLGLDRLSVATKAAARAAKRILEADRVLVAQVQEAYGALYSRLERNGESRRKSAVMDELLRESADARALLDRTRQFIPTQAGVSHQGGLKDAQKFLS